MSASWKCASSQGYMWEKSVQNQFLVARETAPWWGENGNSHCDLLYINSSLQFMASSCSSWALVPLFPWTWDVWWRLFHYHLLTAGILCISNDLPPFVQITLTWAHWSVSWAEEQVWLCFHFNKWYRSWTKLQWSLIFPRLKCTQWMEQIAC